MSHYTAVVLVKSDLDLKKDGMTETDNKVRQLMQDVHDLLAPYNENTAVAEYETNCACIGLTASSTAHKQFNPMIDVKRKEFHDMPVKERPDWSEFIAPILEQIEAAKKSHPFYEKPDPDCEECHGTGKHMTTYNPKSKWDWWVFGGRWNGWLLDAQDNVHVDSIFSNIRPAKELVESDRIPYGVITPDGEWHAKGTMGWWAISTDEVDNWEEQVKKLYADNQDCMAVLVDLHI